MQTEENITVCFSDNSYDNCNLTQIELFFSSGLRNCYRRILTIWKLFYIWEEKLSQSKMVWIVF